MTTVIELLYEFDQFLTTQLLKNSFTADLLATPASKFITELLVIVSIGLISYETIYWSGIYLNLWEYHAKDIFTEIPIHCAHVHIRLNVIKKSDQDKLKEYYELKQKSKYNVLYWNRLTQLSTEIFLLEKFVKYYFEFSPEDFEMNEEPELGSTIEHLRNKTLNIFKESDAYKHLDNHSITIDDVVIYNNKNQLVPKAENNNYLSKCQIETGNVIDSVILV
ncbi:uncharacterized protein SPAPADRAFT_131311 [Spathaspora passalidarum NRRL Y-27907]|uniref:Uncharacterized protein n=1 Tax=Spathaspora passalidarum (strain NRRL Y-27907 / 11-Y1) TaxID=619300 RepID=G3AE57_SPAPN|nr:uncharacterized protein SPAPADRAFT_131311 [Spathaspora passalidarum NRRL Y-27907]EGW35591.1 hypothetical protein SPAPADRAFT_131311 [Spathaspora passalidarum NRRL Y-27907]